MQNAPTTRCEGNAPWPYCTQKEIEMFSVFTQSERQSSEFGTLDLENSAIKSYIGSLAARSRLFAVLAGYVLYHVCADIASTEMP